MAQCNATQTLGTIRDLCRHGATRSQKRKVQSDLTSLTKLELLALCDILHIGDGLSYNKLNRMTKTALSQLIVSDCLS